MDITEFRLKLYPKDFQTVRNFYETTLNLPVVNEWDRGEGDKGVMFQVGPAILELLTPEASYAPIQGTDLSLAVPNVQVLWEQLKDKAPVLFPLRHNKWGDMSFCIADPEGFALTFFTKD